MVSYDDGMGEAKGQRSVCHHMSSVCLHAGEWQEVLFGLPGARSLLYSIRGDLCSLCILEAFVTVLFCFAVIICCQILVFVCQN